jgi:uncharacterized membrane protein
MEAFSDGVFSIAITLLVLEIAVPAADDPHLLQTLLEKWPEYLAYLVSFATIGTTWLNHTTITEYLERANWVLLRLNLLLLFFVSLLPFPTHMLSVFIDEPNSERVAVTVYGVNLFAIAALTSVLWHYARAEALVKPDRDDAELSALVAKLTPGLASYGVVIAIGIALPRMAVALYLVIALFLLVPFREIRRIRKRDHSS